MKEDILEQLVDDYLQLEGYFTRHNIKFRPRADHPNFHTNKDSNHSDIDVIGFHPNKKGFERVRVVSCKSWQAGFRVRSKLAELTENKIISGRAAWKGFRELMSPKWSEAFIDTVEAVTGTRKFTYILAVTVIIGDRRLWENHPPFIKAMQGNPMQMIELPEMLEHIQKASTTTVAPSDIGRVLQLMRAAQKGRQELLQAVEKQSET